MRTRTAVTAATTTALLTLTACSGGGSSDAKPGPTTTVTVTASMSDQEILDAADGVLESMGTDVDAGIEPDVTLPADEPPAPAGPQTTFSEGTYLVGEDIKAGTYKTTGGSDGCYWARSKNDSGEADAIIANDLGGGPSRVTVKKGEIFETNSCDDWTLVK
jgi:hypothetical protein